MEDLFFLSLQTPPLPWPFSLLTETLSSSLWRHPTMTLSGVMTHLESGNVQLERILEISHPAPHWGDEGTSPPSADLPKATQWSWGGPWTSFPRLFLSCLLTLFSLLPPPPRLFLQMGPNPSFYTLNFSVFSPLDMSLPIRLLQGLSHFGFSISKVRFYVW